MHFCKMHGLGNDFMVIDALSQAVKLSSDMIRKLANRHRGVGFDQLLLVEPPFDPEVDFHYRIFNNDGTEVFQCGNGARCLAAFVHHKKLTNKKKITISTASSRLTLSLLERKKVQVGMGKAIFDPKQIPFIAHKQEKNYLLLTDEGTVIAGVVSLGNPHCIVQVENLKTVPIARLGALLERHQRFPEKTNVGFMQVLSKSRIALRVFERGAGETNACGSGAVAAVAVGIANGLLAPRVVVEQAGGVLEISQAVNGEMIMTGEAQIVYDGEIDLHQFITSYKEI